MEPLYLEGSLSLLKKFYYKAEIVSIGAFYNILEEDPATKVLPKVVNNILNLTAVKLLEGRVQDPSKMKYLDMDPSSLNAYKSEFYRSEKNRILPMKKGPLQKDPISLFSPAAAK